LSSLRWLTTLRILSYVRTTLGLLPPPTLLTESPSGEDENVNVKIPIESDWLELLCKDKVLEPQLDLAAIKTFFWKSGDEMVLHYRRKAAYRDLPVEMEEQKTRK
jgi:hypothetical protein